MNRFWRFWLTCWCFAVGLFGLLFYGVGFSATTSPAAVIFAAFSNPLPNAPDRYLRLTTSLMGAVTAGWAITLYVAFRAAWALDDPIRMYLWRGTTAALLAWFVIDSGASIATGFALNAGSNTILLLAYLIPVLVTGSLFAHSTKTRPS